MWLRFSVTCSNFYVIKFVNDFGYVSSTPVSIVNNCCKFDM